MRMNRGKEERETEESGERNREGKKKEQGTGTRNMKHANKSNYKSTQVLVHQRKLLPDPIQSKHPYASRCVFNRRQPPPEAYFYFVFFVFIYSFICSPSEQLHLFYLHAPFPPRAPPPPPGSCPCISGSIPIQDRARYQTLRTRAGIRSAAD